MKILFDLIIGILLYIVLTTGRWVVHATSHRSAILERVQNFIPAFTAVAWYLYGLWILRRWFSESYPYPILVFFYISIPALLVAWYVLRDILAGTVASGRRQLRMNRHIQSGNVSGRIIGKGITHFVLRTDNGDVARIPYSRLNGEVVTERAEDTESEYYRIHLSVSKRDSREKVQAGLARDIAAIPWASAATAPIIKLKSQSDAAYDFEVLFRSLNSRHAARVEHILRNAYED